MTDGRIAVGSIEVIDRRTFLAVDVDGRIIGRFQTLRAAARALPIDGSPS